MNEHCTLNPIIARVKAELAELGLSRDRFWNYSGGLRTILQHFENQGVAYTSEAGNKYIETIREEYENGRVSHNKFCILRKCMSFIDAVYHGESVDLTRLQEWEHSRNPLRASAIAEQMNNPNDLYGLVCKVRVALNEMGYSKTSVKAYNYHGFDRILRHCSDAGVADYDKNLIDAFVVSAYEQDLKENAHKVRKYLPRKAAALLDEYSRTGEITTSRLTPFKTPNPSGESMILLEKYLGFGRKEMKYSAGSLINRRNTVRRYLLALESLGCRDLSKLTLPDAKRAIMEYLQPGSEKTSMLYPIRDFLNYLYENNITSRDLSIVVPRKYSPKRHIKEGYSPSEADALLNSVNRETPLGKRDYAAMLLALSTGLRGSDVINMTFSDINWKLWEINIVQQKTGNPVKIALTASVGNAVADYILNGRPKSASPYIFLRHKIPYERLTAPSCIIKRHLPLTTLDGQTVRSKGFHGFRRAFGVGLLRAGTPFQLLSDMLGTVRPDSVKPYLALHDQELKNCALPLLAKEGELE